MILADGNGQTNFELIPTPTTELIPTIVQEIVPTPIQTPKTVVANFGFWLIFILMVLGILVFVIKRMKGGE